MPPEGSDLIFDHRHNAAYRAERLLVYSGRTQRMSEHCPPVCRHWLSLVGVRVLIDLEPGGHRLKVFGDRLVLPVGRGTIALLRQKLFEYRDDLVLA
jgi:hypothetical protein